MVKSVAFAAIYGFERHIWFRLAENPVLFVGFISDRVSSSGV